MILWIDEHLSRRLAPWLETTFGVTAYHMHDLGLSSAPDTEIYQRAGATGAVLLTKDADFRDLVLRRGAPPQLIWLTTGNSSTRFLRGVFSRQFPAVRAALEGGEAIVELTR